MKQEGSFTLRATANYLWNILNPRPALIIDAAVLQKRPVAMPIQAQAQAQPPVLKLEVAKQNILEPPRSLAPYEQAGFGLDRSRNMDSINPDSYLELPLESEGKTHLTRDKYEEVDVDVETLKIRLPVKQAKFIRLQVHNIRSSSETVAIGGIRFFYGNRLINDLEMKMWNPHTGISVPYSNGPWTDTDQWSIVFCFSQVMDVNRYEIKTSNESEENDPVQWTIEGSLNGAFWYMLDDRTGEDTFLPSIRGFPIGYWMKK